MPALAPSRPAKEQGDQQVGLEGLPVQHGPLLLTARVSPVKRDWVRRSRGLAADARLARWDSFGAVTGTVTRRRSHTSRRTRGSNPARSRGSGKRAPEPR